MQYTYSCARELGTGNGVPGLLGLGVGGLGFKGQGTHRSSAERAIQKLSACSVTLRSPHSSSAVTPYTTSDADTLVLLRPESKAKHHTHRKVISHRIASHRRQVSHAVFIEAKQEGRGCNDEGGRGARSARGYKSRGGWGGNEVGLLVTVGALERPEADLCHSVVGPKPLQIPSQPPAAHRQGGVPGRPIRKAG